MKNSKTCHRPHILCDGDLPGKSGSTLRFQVAISVLSLVPALSYAQSESSVPAVTLGTIEVPGQAYPPNAQQSFDTQTQTGSRLGLSIRETPATVTIVDRSAIEARGAHDTQEMLRGVAGVNASAPPGSISVSYRGFTSGQLAVLYNGITAQDSGQATRPVDSWIYDRVEVVGGPSGFLYGAGAVGGSINYLTKVANREASTDAQVRLGSYGLRAVSVGMNREISSADTSGPRHYIRVEANDRRSDGWVDGNASRGSQVALSLLSDLTPNLSHLLAYEYQREKEHRTYFGTPVLNPLEGSLSIDPSTRFKNYNSEDALYAQRVQWLRSVLDYRVNDRLSLKNTAYMFDTQRDFQNVETYVYDASNRRVVRSGPYLQRHTHQLYGDRLEGNYKSSLGTLESEWAFGIEFSEGQRTNYPKGLSTVVSAVDPYRYQTESFYSIPGMTPGFNADRKTTLRTTSFSLENRTALRKDLHLVTAFRHEKMDLNVKNFRQVTSTNPANYSKDYSANTGRIGLVWDATPTLNFYAQYATSADAPAGVLTSTNAAALRTATKLSEGQQIEVGSRINFWDNKGSLSVAAFEIKRKNIATADVDDPRATALVGQQSSRGLETTLGLQPTSALRFQVNAAYVDAQYDDFAQVVSGQSISRNGNRPVNVPAFVANAWIDYDLAPQWTASAGLRHVAKVYGNAANSYSVPSFTLLDLGLEYRLNRSVTFNARVKNVTNKLYAQGTNSISYYYAGPPRTAELAIRVRY